MNYKLAILKTVQTARDVWAAGDDERALELLNEALEDLVCHGQSEETLPVVFAHIKRIRELLIANGAGA